MKLLGHNVTVLIHLLSEAYTLILHDFTANKHETTTILPLKLDIILLNLTGPKIKAGRPRDFFL